MRYRKQIRFCEGILILSLSVYHIHWICSKRCTYNSAFDRFDGNQRSRTHLPEPLCKNFEVVLWWQVWFCESVLLFTHRDGHFVMSRVVILWNSRPVRMTVFPCFAGIKAERKKYYQILLLLAPESVLFIHTDISFHYHTRIASHGQHLNAGAPYWTTSRLSSYSRC
jgi:hypothetical protein